MKCIILLPITIQSYLGPDFPTSQDKFGCSRISQETVLCLPKWIGLQHAKSPKEVLTESLFTSSFVALVITRGESHALIVFVAQLQTLLKGRNLRLYWLTVPRCSGLSTDWIVSGPYCRPFLTSWTGLSWLWLSSKLFWHELLGLSVNNISVKDDNEVIVFRKQLLLSPTKIRMRACGGTLMLLYSILICKEDHRTPSIRRSGIINLILFFKIPIIKT